jgi:peptidoglycan/xylan/chitin deacetylase (PgdA/CDA1 family)
MDACLSVDVEEDCPPYLSTWRGIEEGLPRLLNLLEELAVTATFFVTGETARRHPAAVRGIADRGHEVGCHGDRHRLFTRLDENEARAEIAAATAALRPFGNAVSFRAPHLCFPRGFLTLLEEQGYRVDSSVGRHKSFGAAAERVGSITRVPASVTSSTLRWPAFARNAVLMRLAAPAVLFVHPWEFVDFRRTSLRFDCRFRTGDPALECLKATLLYLRARGTRFETLATVADRLQL